MVYTSSNAMSKSVQVMSKQSRNQQPPPQQQKQPDQFKRDPLIASKKESKHSSAAIGQHLHAAPREQAQPLTRCRQPQMAKNPEQSMHKQSERLTSTAPQRQSDRNFCPDSGRQLLSTGSGAVNADCSSKYKNPIDRNNGYDFDADDRHIDAHRNHRSIHNHPQNVSADSYVDDEFAEVNFIEFFQPI